MSLKLSNKISSNQCEMEIEVSAEEFNKEVDRVYKSEIKRINVPGFRKGKAPRGFVEKFYGEGIFYEDAIKNIYPCAVDEAAKEAGVEIVDDDIKIDIIKADKKEGLVFKVKAYIIPEINIGKYKGIEVEKINVEVTDEDLDKEIEDVRMKNSRLVTVENKPAEMGNSVVIDFEGFIDGKAFEGGKAEEFTLELGKKQFIEGFEDQIVGHSTNEEFDVNVKFPENYHAKNYAGKDAVFKVKLHEIKERELPEFDDEFVKDISELNTVAEYKEDLKKNLIEKKKERADIDRENKIIEKLTELVEADIPESMIRLKLSDIVRDFEYRLQSQGISMRDYIKYTGTKMEDIREQFKPQAEHQVKLSLAFRKIAELENIVPTKDDIEAEYKRIAEHYKMEESKIRAVVPLEDIEKDVESQKALAIVKANVVEK